MSFYIIHTLRFNDIEHVILNNTLAWKPGFAWITNKQTGKQRLLLHIYIDILMHKLMFNAGDESYVGRASSLRDDRR